MIDRPIRPGFADGFKQEVHIVATTLACDGQNPPDCICVGRRLCRASCAASAPFDGPAACVRIARNAETGEFIVNPTYAEAGNKSDLELTIAGTKDYISMVEAGAQEVSEEDMLAAMELRPAGHRRLLREAERNSWPRSLPSPSEYPVHVPDASIAERVDAHYRRDERSPARCRQAFAHRQG